MCLQYSKYLHSFHQVETSCSITQCGAVEEQSRRLVLLILLLLPSVVAPPLLLTTSLSLQIHVLAQLVEVQVGEVGYCHSWIKTLSIMARLWRWRKRVAITLQKLLSCMDSSVAEDWLRLPWN